nr:ribosomal protein S18 [Cylindrocapsa geminella]
MKYYLRMNNFQNFNLGNSPSKNKQKDQKNRARDQKNRKNISNKTKDLRDRTRAQRNRRNIPTRNQKTKNNINKKKTRNYMHKKKRFYSKIIDYKNFLFLSNYIGRGGKILSRAQNGFIAKHQRYTARAIKNGRIMGLMNFVTKEKGYFT